MRLFPVPRLSRRTATGDLFNGSETLYVNSEDHDGIADAVTKSHFLNFRAIELGRPAPILKVLEQMPPGYAMGVRDGKIVFMIQPPKRPKLPQVDIAAVEAAEVAAA